MYLSNKCWFAFPWSSFSYYICFKKSDKIISNTFNIHIWVQGHLCPCSRNWKSLLWLEHSSEDCSETSPHTDAENIKLIWDRLLLQWSMLLSNFPQVPPARRSPQILLLLSLLWSYSLRSHRSSLSDPPKSKIMGAGSICSLSKGTFRNHDLIEILFLF